MFCWNYNTPIHNITIGVNQMNFNIKVLIPVCHDQENHVAGVDFESSGWMLKQHFDIKNLKL